MMSRLLIAALLCSVLMVRDAEGQDSPPVESAVEICRSLLPGFVDQPQGLDATVQAGKVGAPTGVELTWSGNAARPELGGGHILCWFLPPETTGFAWQVGTVDSSEYGTLTRYDVQQLIKLLRLRPTDPQRIKVDQSAPLMPWLYALQQSINALSLGGVYALVAVGFTLIYASGRIINFAHGEIYMIGAFLALFGFVLQQSGGGPVAAVLTPILLVAVCGLGGWALYRIVFRRLIGGGLLPPMIATIGLSIVLREAIRLLHGPKTRWLPPQEGWSWAVVTGRGFDVYLSGGHLIIVGATGAAALALWLIGRHSRIGRSFRAATEDAAAAALMGVPIGRLFGGAFALGAAFAGTAGGFAAWHYGPVDFHMGTLMGLKALTAAIIGGIGSVPGAFAGALAVAGVEVAAASLVGSAWRDIAVFGLLVLFLVFRPQGLFGKPHDPFGRTSDRDAAASSIAVR
jgi:branched-chain amino acid transport system permease protein